MRNDERKVEVSRRKFLRKAMAGAGGTAAILGANAPLGAQGRPAPRAAAAGAAPAVAASAPAAPRIPAEFAAAKSAKLPTLAFPMNGAQVFAKACKDEGVAAMFCCPGNYGMIHAIASAGIPAFGGRHEGAMCNAADAFIASTGELAVTSGTEGPGFTNMINAIGSAYARRTPLLVIASNKAMREEDTEMGIQVGYQQPTTEGLKKYGKRLIDPSRIYEYTTYAFRQLRTGIPQPVHLDFPSEVANAKFNSASDLEYYHDKGKYRTEARPHADPKSIAAAVALIRTAQRPIIVPSTGVFYAKGWDALKAFAEKAQIPVAESGAVKGLFSDASPLSANASPSALSSADLVILVGQYSMPNVGEFAFGPDAKYIRIDMNAADIGRNIPIDLGIVSCEKAALEALAEAVPAMKHDSWVAEIAAARKAHEDECLSYYKTGMGYTDNVHPAVIAHELAAFLYNGKIPRDQTTVVSGGYTLARYFRREMRAYRPAQTFNGAYQYGAIGPDIGYAVGVSAGVTLGIGVQKAYQGHPIVAMTGDAGLGQTIMEIETMSKNRLPAVLIVYNNNAWATWSGVAQQAYALPIHLFHENIRYDKIAESLGGAGEYVTKPGDFRPALERAYELAARESTPVLLNCQGRKEFGVAKDFPPGFLGKVEPGCMSYYH